MPYSFPKAIVENPLAMLCFYDEDVQSGRLKLAQWQIEMLQYFGREHRYGDKSIESILLAANGSGKSQFIIAPLVTWFAMKFIKSQSVITNASGAQLDSGNLRHSTALAEKINTFHKKEFPEGIFDCKYRKLYNKVTDSYCDMFATDEAGKVEGKHPLTFDGKLLILIDEAKSVADEIFNALLRSHDYTHKLLVSSAGGTNGTFYNDWQFEDPEILKKRVTAFDCPYIPVERINKLIAKHGLHDPLIRSMFFSEFTSSEEQVVISRELLVKSSNLCDTWYKFGPLRAGLDLAAGGDEAVFDVWHGNKQIARETCRNADTSKTVRWGIDFLESFKGELKPEKVNADDGGVGRGILDNFREKGYKFRRVLNQARPFDVTRYANRGTELWFNFKRFLEEYQVLFLKDEKGNMDATLLSQMSNRYYTQRDNNKLILESKQKAKAQGHPSPDRADACVLAWCDLVYPVAEINGHGAAPVKQGLSLTEVYNELRNANRAKLNKTNNHKDGKFPTKYTEAQLNSTPNYAHKNVFRSRDRLSRYFSSASK